MLGQVRAAIYTRGGSPQAKFDAYEAELVSAIQRGMELQALPSAASSTTAAEVTRILRQKCSESRDENRVKSRPSQDMEQAAAGLAGWFALTGQGLRKVAEKFFDMHYVDLGGTIRIVKL